MQVGRAAPAALPSSQQIALTPASWTMIVPSRSGSAITASAPAASIASRRSGERVVPRTAWPSASSDLASSRPRQPQPTISTRANAQDSFARARRRSSSRQRSSSATCARMSSSVRSGRPLARRRAFCASSI